MSPEPRTGLLDQISIITGKAASWLTVVMVLVTFVIARERQSCWTYPELFQLLAATKEPDQRKPDSAYQQQVCQQQQIHYYRN